MTFPRIITVNLLDIKECHSSLIKSIILVKPELHLNDDHNFTAIKKKGTCIYLNFEYTQLKPPHLQH